MTCPFGSSNSALSSQDGGSRSHSAYNKQHHGSRYKESYNYNRGTSGRSVGGSSVTSGGGRGGAGGFAGRHSSSAYDQPTTPRSGIYDVDGLDVCVWDDDDDRQSQRSQYFVKHEILLPRREEEEAALVCFSLANISIVST